MDKEEAPEPIAGETLLQDLIVNNKNSIKEFDEKYDKLIKEFRLVYQKDIQMLNKILSTYEDKLVILENQFYNLSFKLKQLHATVTKEE